MYVTSILVILKKFSSLVWVSTKLNHDFYLLLGNEDLTLLRSVKIIGDKRTVTFSEKLCICTIYQTSIKLSILYSKWITLSFYRRSLWKDTSSFFGQDVPLNESLNEKRHVEYKLGVTPVISSPKTSPTWPGTLFIIVSVLTKKRLLIEEGKCTKEREILGQDYWNI